MGPTGITVVLAVHWLTGVVGAASLPSDDQYSPYESPYRKDVAQGSLSYPNWLKYQQDLTSRLEVPYDSSERSKGEDNYFLRERLSDKDSLIRDLDILPLTPGRWDTANFADSDARNSRKSESGYLDSRRRGDLSEDDFVRDETFQDQGPGSVEVYKLDLRHENSLLVPPVDKKHTTRAKSKIPKKVISEDIIWKLKSIETNKTPLPPIFHQEPKNFGSPLSKITDNDRDEVFAIGGVPELQVGCEGLEASERDKRESENTHEDWKNDPVYRESTEPILLRMTPIVLDMDEDEPPSGEIYEEMDELVKLKKLESTSPKPTTKRWNRADIDPVLEMDKHQNEDRTGIETYPERGDLGPGNNSSEITEDNQEEKKRFRRDVFDNSHLSSDESGNFQSPRKLLWARYPEDQTNSRQANNRDQDLWGFAEEDGDLPEEDTDILMLEAEREKRRREYERRKQEEFNRRRGHRPQESRDITAEIEKIREQHEKQLEMEQRERKRIQGRREWDRRQGYQNQRNPEEVRRNEEEESRRRSEVEERRREWNRRRDEEERRRRLESQRNREYPPSPLTRNDPRNTSESHQREDEERKLRDYIERNRPIDPKRSRVRPDRPGNGTDEERRRLTEEQRHRADSERRRQQMEDYRKRLEEERQRQTSENRGRQMENQRRPQSDTERRREMEERRRYDERRRTDDRRIRPEDVQRLLEEERKLQDYVRRNQPVTVPRGNNSQSVNSSRETDLEQQRRTMQAAREWEHNRQSITRGETGRIHGPSAPTNIGNPQRDSEEIRRRQERLEEERRLAHRRNLEAEERRRELEYQRAESQRREEERKRLEAARRDDEIRRTQSVGRGRSWQDYGSSRRPSSEPSAEELRRRESTRRPIDGTKDQDEWKRSQEHYRRQQEERDRQRLENERNSRINGRRRPYQNERRPNHRQPGESYRGGHDSASRRREHARLNSLPVQARIIIQQNGFRNGSRTPTRTSLPSRMEPSISSRGNFGNDINFPGISPNRPGLSAGRFPAPQTSRPPVASPDPCAWAIVHCCPASNRLPRCFESVGCPGGHWDMNPCRNSLVDAAQEAIVKFYESSNSENRRF